MARPTHRWAEADLADLRERALLRTLTPLRSAQGPVVELSDGQRLLNFSSNDYLGLAADPLLIAAAKEGLTRWGLGSGASRLVVGDFEPHGALEVALARFERSEAVRVFNSGYAANSSLVPGLVGAGDAVFSDALNHASLIDGCRLSRAEVLVYPHGEVDALEVQLGRSAARRKLVVTDTVFSMDGDVAALPALVAACEQNGAALLVDEAHATGVLGERGAGACEALGVEDRVDLRMGTLSKALGGMGAYVATSRAVAELLVSRARPLIFSTALPPPGASPRSARCGWCRRSRRGASGSGGTFDDLRRAYARWAIRRRRAPPSSRWSWATPRRRCRRPSSCASGGSW